MILVFYLKSQQWLEAQAQNLSTVGRSLAGTTKFTNFTEVQITGAAHENGVIVVKLGLLKL